ncbi:MAG: FadR family transcriptional regulator [bacterium]|nr:FadR family transcriptional regulator [bacterium]
MEEMLKPLQAESLKDMFVKRFEDLIFSGKLSIGEKLPSERDLAAKLNISRPVVHEGLVELAARGLISMKPRAGAVVNDFRKDGSIELLTALINYSKGKLDPLILESLVNMRKLFEIENARLAAQNRTDAHIADLKEILALEDKIDIEHIDEIIELDFRFHHSIAIATGNLVYPLLLNSFKTVYTNISGHFFTRPPLAKEVFVFHRELTDAVEQKYEIKAVEAMKKMLLHGENQLRKIYEKGAAKNAALLQG